MTPVGHTSISYLISQSKIKGELPLTKREIVFILVCGNVFDFDYILLPFIGVPGYLHHYSPTHTPLYGLAYLLLFYLLLHNIFPLRTFILAGLAMLSHLVLDDISYWFSLLGILKDVHPQIFWLFPFDTRYLGEMTWAFGNYLHHDFTFSATVYAYLIKGYAVVVAELTIIGFALKRLTVNNGIVLTCQSIREKFKLR